ncbi:MAG TPA: helix-turn-helix transcriptional regulator [Pseudoclavibacter sp.]|nr:helix-turn-helix transcriptional regulator [Pseudoclavibacter sp.]
MVLVRQELGDVLRDVRLQKGRTLRQVAGRASVALGYLSEVERGHKEASSEILASVADALDTPVSVIMREVSDRLAMVEEMESAALGRERVMPPVSRVPDVVPPELVSRYDADLLRS